MHLLVASLDETDFINDICVSEEIHHLLIEDIFFTSHIPKLEIFENYYFLILKYLEFESDEDIFKVRQISIFLKNNLVLVFTEKPLNPVLEDIKKRLAEFIGNLRQQKSDYLFYRIIDQTVDQYNTAVNYIGIKVDDLDERSTEGESLNISGEIVEIKKHINTIRRISVPLLEEITRIKNINAGMIRKPILTYFQDILDHLSHNIATLESFREILTDLMELHFAQMSASMNQVMKTLTVVTTIFIPLTFIAGVYGMNFHNMPEIGWKWGYLAFWILILGITIMMISVMRKKKWF